MGMSEDTSAETTETRDDEWIRGYRIAAAEWSIITAEESD